MINANQTFVDNNVGLELKIRKFSSSEEYFYGRLFNVGYGIDSMPSKMFDDIISIITPDGNIISCRVGRFELLNEKDKELLSEIETLYQKPYYPHLVKSDNKYYRGYEFNKETLKCMVDQANKENICYINKQMFGQALSYICSVFYEKDYYYNNYKFIYKGKKNKETHGYDEFQERFISTISSIQYPSVIEQKFGNKLYKPYRNLKHSGASWNSLKYETMFFQRPLKINDDELLLFFNEMDSDKIKIGQIINNKFIPNIQIFEKTSPAICDKEISFSIDNFNFVNDFIIEIVKYKLQTGKIDIDEEDMELIVQEYEKQNIKQKVKKINM